MTILNGRVVKYIWRLKDSRRVLTIICGVISRRENVEITYVHHLAYANKARIGDVRSLCSNRERREKTLRNRILERCKSSS